jgi:AbrB family looped-hinge helix DNA binding protein
MLCRSVRHHVQYGRVVTEPEPNGLGADLVVNSQGRVTIPAQIRREAGIEAGTPLVVYVEDGRVVLETRAQLAQRIRREIAEAWAGEARWSTS